MDIFAPSSIAAKSRIESPRRGTGSKGKKKSLAIATSPEAPPTGNLMARGRTQRGGMNGLKQLLAKHESHRKSMGVGPTPSTYDY